MLIFGSFMRHTPVHAPASLCPDYIVYYICFLFINPGKFADETLIKIKIQFIQNKIQFKERLSIKQNVISGQNDPFQMFSDILVFYDPSLYLTHLMRFPFHLINIDEI